MMYYKEKVIIWWSKTRKIIWLGHLYFGWRNGKFFLQWK